MNEPKLRDGRNVKEVTFDEICDGVRSERTNAYLQSLDDYGYIDWLFNWEHHITVPDLFFISPDGFRG